MIDVQFNLLIGGEITGSITDHDFWASFPESRKEERMKGKPWGKIAIILGLALLLVTLPLIGACGDDDVEKTETVTEEPTKTAATEEPKEEIDKTGWPEDIVWAGGNVGGAYHTFEMTFARLVEQELGVRSTVQTTGGPGERAKLINTNEAQFSHLGGDTVYDGQQGIGFYEGKKVPGRIIVGVSPPIMHYIVKADSDIESIADLKGKKAMIWVASAPPTMTVNKVANLLLEFNGIDKETDLTALSWHRNPEATEALMEGRADVVLWMGSPGSSGITELAQNAPGGIRIIPLSQEEMDYVNIENNSPWAVPRIIPAGTYKGVDSDVQTFSIDAALICRTELADTFIYEMVKTLWDHIEDFYKVSPMLKFYTIENTVNYPGIFHAGAIKYYKEIGVWTDEHQQRQDKMLAAAGDQK